MLLELSPVLIALLLLALLRRMSVVLCLWNKRRKRLWREFGEEGEEEEEEEVDPEPRVSSDAWRTSRGDTSGSWDITSMLARGERSSGYGIWHPQKATLTRCLSIERAIERARSRCSTYTLGEDGLFELIDLRQPILLALLLLLNLHAYFGLFLGLLSLALHERLGLLALEQLDGRLDVAHPLGSFGHRGT